MTELLATATEVRTDRIGRPVAVQLRGQWLAVDRITNRWRVETDWWRTPVRRDTLRCVLDGDECVEVSRDLTTGAWSLVRRYD